MEEEPLSVRYAEPHLQGARFCLSIGSSVELRSEGFAIFAFPYCCLGRSRKAKYMTFRADYWLYMRSSPDQMYSSYWLQCNWGKGSDRLLIWCQKSLCQTPLLRMVL
jgi:hypothetical protein